MYGFSHAETDGWANAVTIGFLVASAVLLTVFVALQQRVAHPLLPMRVVLAPRPRRRAPRCSARARLALLLLIARPLAVLVLPVAVPIR